MKAENRFSGMHGRKESTHEQPREHGDAAASRKDQGDVNGPLLPGILSHEEGTIPRASVWQVEAEGKSWTRGPKPADRAPLPQASGKHGSLGTLPSQVTGVLTCPQAAGGQSPRKGAARSSASARFNSDRPRVHSCLA